MLMFDHGLVFLLPKAHRQKLVLLYTPQVRAISFLCQTMLSIVLFHKLEKLIEIHLLE